MRTRNTKVIDEGLDLLMDVARSLKSKDPSVKGCIVWDREGKESGHTTGHTRTCACGSVRTRVLWKDKKWTWPCVKSLKRLENGQWQIL